MSLEDKLREQLPRLLQQIDIIVIPYLSWEPALVIFKANGRSVEFDIDPATGLTDAQIAQLCLTF
jgi:hypothetical protein